MSDKLTPAARSAVMRAVKGRDTGPELAVRRMLHAAGYRYRTQLRIGRGRPDIVFTRRKKVVLVHGCFWHGHDCGRGRLPTTNALFWTAKIEGNKDRDHRTLAMLNESGWSATVVWECELRNPDTVLRELQQCLGPPVVCLR